MGWATTFVRTGHTAIEMGEISTFNIGPSQKSALFALQANLLQTIHSPTLDHDGTSTLILPTAQMSVQRCMGPWRSLIKKNQNDRRRMEVGSKVPHYLGSASFFTKPNFLTAADKFPAGGGKVGYQFGTIMQKLPQRQTPSGPRGYPVPRLLYKMCYLKVVR